MFKYPNSFLTKLVLLQNYAHGLNEGCLDFIIKNKNTPIEHIYLAHLQKNPETPTFKFLETVEKMKLNFLNAKEWKIISYHLLLNKGLLFREIAFKKILVLSEGKMHGLFC